ncbi:MAG: ABC transporter permease [Bacteroidota bacterium]|nr:ABC transporter permease [Bacteroidota bacterium]
MNKITNHQLYRLIAAHFLEIIREPSVLFWGIVFPILMAWGLGIAFTQKGELTQRVAIIRTEPDIKLSAFLKDHTSHNGNLFKTQLKNKKLGNINLIFEEVSWPKAFTMLKKGDVNLILEEHLNNVEYHFDPTNADAKLLYQQISNTLKYGAEYYTNNEAEIKPLTVTGTRYIDFLIPGLLAMGIMMSCTWGISYTLIDRRSKKLLRRMVATPMKKSNFLFALMTARFTMNIVEGGLLYLFAWLYFGIHIQGSIPALIAVFIAGNIAFSGMSILISSHTANPEIGNGLINAIVTPMMVVSGVFFSYHNFPEWSQPVIQYLPLTMLADSMRSIFNEGAGFTSVVMDTLVLSGIGAVSFIAGLKIFKWY